MRTKRRPSRLRRILERARLNERRLVHAQAIAHVGSWDWEMATNRVTWSDELYRIYGISLETPAGYPAFLERVHQDDRERVGRIIWQGMSERRAVDYEFRLIRPDGEQRDILARNVVILDGTGEPIGLAGTSLDITERKRAEQNLHTVVRELQVALLEVRTLRGMLKICSACKRINADDGSWQPIEAYVRDHSGAEFSHGLCPSCAEQYVTAHALAEPARG